MKILACFKVLPDPERILDSDYETFSLEKDLSYAGLEFNCFDKSAFETALKLKEQAAVQGAEATCAALTVSERFSDSMAEILYASGFDQVIAVKGSGTEFNPEYTASILEKAIREINPDIILTGSEAGYAETGMVPFYLSEKMGIPLVSGVETAQLEGKTVTVKYRCGEGFCDKKVIPPVNICIGNSPETLRVPGLRNRLACKGKTAERQEVILENKESEKIIFRMPNGERNCEILEFNEKIVEKILDFLKNTKKRDTGKKEIKYPEKTIYLEPEGEYGYEDINIPEIVKGKDIILLPNTEAGKKGAIAIAERLQCKCLFKGEYKGIKNGKITVSKRVMASNLEATTQFSTPVVLTVENGRPKNVETERLILSKKDPSWLIYDLVLRPPESDILETADTVIICGGGVTRKETAKKARELGKKLNAGFGLTRIAVMDGFGSSEEIIGQSGHLLNAGCILVLGASGAGAFSVGIEKAGKIIAVNTNKNALIFKKSDYGLRIDAEAVIDGLLEKIE